MSDIAQSEQKIRELWRSINLLEKIQKSRDKEKFFLLDGPPYANYVPHVGHIRNTVYKDLYIRWEMMKGKDVLFQPGFDTHGLPIENMVEKKLNLTSKKDIQKLGISKFMQICRDSAALNKDLWMETYDMLGSWYSWKEPYLTYDNNYIESTWWSFKKLWDKDMVYQGKKPVFWCPKCETALAGYEATDSYKNVTDPSIYVKFPVKNEDNTFLLVYTTTPWTLPANVALVVAPNEDYVKAKTEKHGTLILAKNLLKLLDEHDTKYEITETFKGKTLQSLEYESVVNVPIQDELKNNPNALKVYLSIPILKERVGSKVAAKKGLKSGDIFEDFVTVEEGTGIVHCAPGHGKSDSEIGKQYDLPALSPLNDQCHLTEDAAPFDGKFVKDADHDIADWIEKKGRLFHYGTIEHSYPLCWRCKAPLIFRLSNQWFLKIDSIKEEMLEANENVNWQPEYAKERFSSWVANADDWNFSRQRYWGVPIPVWQSEDGDSIAIGSIEELSQYTTVPKDFDLHAVSELEFTKDNKTYKRINDIFDVWFDSGSAPYASLHYPFENKELFEQNMPIGRINESQDQVRGWFYSLMFCGISTFGNSPYKTVSMPGWVLDAKGEKMSKSLGNVVFAKDALEEFGADAVRFYYCWDITPGSTQKFNLDTIKTDVRRTMTIWRNLTKLTDQEPKLSETKAVEDQWLLSRLNNTIKEVHKSIESFDLHLAGRALSQFIVEDLSRSYVQFTRSRMEDDKTPKQLISYSLHTLAKLSAAITPHLSEEVYQALPGEKLESVHLERLPNPDMKLINEELEEYMSLAQDVIAGILAARDRSQLGVRWPLQEAIVDTQDEKTKAALKLLKPLVLAQTNIKELKVESFKVNYNASANFQSLGKTFGQETGTVAGLIKAHADEVIKGVTGKDKKVTIKNFEILADHVNLEKIIPEDFSFGEFKRGSTYTPTSIPQEIEMEGFAREVTRRFQQLRKEQGMQKEDSIKAAIVGLDLVDFKDDIAKTIGASALSFEEIAHDVKSDAKVRGKKFSLFLKK